jgi:pyrroline-5-carboxylate reductase
MSNTLIDKYRLPAPLADKLMHLCHEIHMDVIKRTGLPPEVAKTLVAHVLATIARAISETDGEPDEKIIH